MDFYKKIYLNILDDLFGYYPNILDFCITQTKEQILYQTKLRKTLRYARTSKIASN
jgi:hypothetical protein